MSKQQYRKLAERTVYYFEQVAREHGMVQKPGDLFTVLMLVMASAELRKEAVDRLKQEETEHGGPDWWQQP